MRRRGFLASVLAFLGFVDHEEDRWPTPGANRWESDTINEVTSNRPVSIYSPTTTNVHLNEAWRTIQRDLDVCARFAADESGIHSVAQGGF